jgi:demethylmenaquinone methyltransferase/2-methoxy-6-polyprenyl-1,4-benzoquinol methylase
MTITSSESGAKLSRRETNFGFQRVAADDHRGLVGAVFDSVAGRYDLMNDLMSGGLHRLWKQALIDALDPRPGMRLLDVAGGTGDVAFRAIERAETRSDQSDNRGGQSLVTTICDPSEAMLDVARNRAIDKGLLKGIDFVCAPAESLPFEDRSADACTISFGLRNVTDRPAALAEMRRVLEIGGHFLCLEFSPAVLPLLAPLYDAYSYKVLPWLGDKIAGDADSYRYLAESIRRFPPPEALSAELKAAGFGAIRHRIFSGGIVALHTAWRT